jgi:Lon protease-like protein
MKDDSFPFENFTGVARLFPLPNIVFFPFMVLPLHIFEPRYRQMTEDALAGDQLITMVLLRPGWEDDYEGKPAICPVGCLGKIIGAQRLQNGRFNLLLSGLTRVRILDEIEQDKPYRSAHVHLLHDFCPAAPPGLKDLQQRLAMHVTAWLGASESRAEMEKALKADLPLGALCDLISFTLPLAADIKQEMLEQLNVMDRVAALLHYLETTQPPTASDQADHRFPPGFSSN